MIHVVLGRLVEKWLPIDLRDGVEHEDVRFAEAGGHVVLQAGDFSGHGEIGLERVATCAGLAQLVAQRGRALGAIAVVDGHGGAAAGERAGQWGDRELAGGAVTSASCPVRSMFMVALDGSEAPGRR